MRRKSRSDGSGRGGRGGNDGGRAREKEERAHTRTRNQSINQSNAHHNRTRTFGNERIKPKPKEPPRALAAFGRTRVGAAERRALLFLLLLLPPDAAAGARLGARAAPRQCALRATCTGAPHQRVFAAAASSTNGVQGWFVVSRSSVGGTRRRSGTAATVLPRSPLLPSPTKPNSAGGHAQGKQRQQRRHTSRRRRK